MKYILLLFLCVFFTNFAYAEKHKRTWDYPLNFYDKFEVKGSNDAHIFAFDLRKDADVTREIENNTETGVIGYLLECPDGSGWCKVEIDGFEGWLRRVEFWGAYAKEVLR